MKFETILNAFEIASSRMMILPLMSQAKRTRTQRQILRFRTWLLEHHRPACRAKRLKWTVLENYTLTALTQVGEYQIVMVMEGEYLAVYENEPSISKILVAGASVSTAKAACQAHFDSVWREMTEEVSE